MSSATQKQFSENQALKPETKANPRCEALASRLEAGAAALSRFAQSLSETDWQVSLVKDKREVGLIVHHVASVYPVEIQLAKSLAAGESITGLTREGIDQMNADHAEANRRVSKEEALALLAKNSAAAAAAIRELRDEELDRAAPVSLYGDAPLTCQFFLEDHAVRHSYHHLALIRAALGR